MSAPSDMRAARAQLAQRVPRRLAQHATAADVRLCVPDDQAVHLPQGQAIPEWPGGARLPRKGEVIYLTSTSAWIVQQVIHELLPGGGLRVELWLEWIGSARHRRFIDVSNFVH